MAEKSSPVAEGSSIFESLFGGFSNGLSIFTNNRFRRKNDTAGGGEEGQNAENDDKSAMDGASGEETEDGLGKKLKGLTVNASLQRTVNVIEEKKKKKLDSVAEFQTAVQPVQSEDNLESVKKKVKRAEEEIAGEKKRRKMQSAGGIAGDEEGKGGCIDSRKRKQDPIADSTVEKLTGSDDTELKMKTKKSPIAAVDSEHQLLRHITRNAKKRQNEDPLPGQGIEQKERKVEKIAMQSEELDSSATEVNQASKRSLDLKEERGEKKIKKKKKTKLLEEIERVESQSRSSKKGPEGLESWAPLGVATRSGAKRKNENDPEELYERKRREMIDGKGYSRTQGSGEQEGVAEMGMADRLRGKRKLRAEDEEEEELNGAKKTRTTREERVDNEERLRRTIFVGNLPVSVKTKHLAREFSKFGAVESARLRSVPLVDSKLPRKAAVITGQLNEARTSLNGYVVFQEETSARAALAHNMAEFNGKHLRVDMATAPSKSGNGVESGIEYDRARTIFVGNLPFDVEDEQVYSLFKSTSPDLEVEAVRVVRDPQTSIGKGFAFVCFKKEVGATNALANAEYTRLRNRSLRIIRFGFRKKPDVRNPRTQSNTENYRSKPRSGAEQRISKRGVSSFEGTRSSKQDGRPGKLTPGLARTSKKGKIGERGGISKLGKVGRKTVGATKRPAVAARKLASQGNSGTVGGGKRKREEKGILCLPPPPPPLSTSAQLTGKLWSVVKSVGSFASSSLKDLLHEPEIHPGTMGGSMRKLLFDMEKRPKTRSGATALRELSRLSSSCKPRLLE